MIPDGTIMKRQRWRGHIIDRVSTFDSDTARLMGMLPRSKRALLTTVLCCFTPRRIVASNSASQHNYAVHRVSQVGQRFENNWLVSFLIGVSLHPALDTSIREPQSSLH